LVYFVVVWIVFGLTKLAAKYHWGFGVAVLLACAAIMAWLECL